MLGWLAVAYLAVAAAGRLHFALPHLLHDVADWSAIDLKYRYNEVAEWFAGRPVYGVVDGAVYPPASHLILWPFLGWLSLEGARLVWTITILLAATAIAWILYALCASAPARERLLLAGLALAAYPLQQAVFVGQLGVHVVALAAGGAFLMFRERSEWWSDALASALLAASLVKPTLSLPLVAAALIAARRIRPALLTAGVYALFTLGAATAQPFGLLQLLSDWLAIAGQRVPFADGVPNLHMLLAAAGLHAWMTPASLTMLAVVSIWMWRERSARPWILMGVAGIVARIWAHSTTYDDAFLLLPMVALHGRVFGGEGRADPVAAVLFVAGWLALLTPTWAFYDLGVTTLRVIRITHTVLWLCVLAYLVTSASRTPGHASTAG